MKHFFYYIFKETVLNLNNKFNLINQKMIKLEEFDKKIDSQIEKESSRTIKLCLLSIKCFLLMSIILFIFIHTLYFLINNLSQNENMKKYLNDILTAYKSHTYNDTNTK